MSVRPFDWRDLPALQRNRNECVFLDSALVLTRGPLLVPGALFSSLVPSMGVLTRVLDGDAAGEASAFGQCLHLAGSPFAYLTYLTPNAALDVISVAQLVESLMSLAGERGALRLLADVDEHSTVFDGLRQCGFAVYSRQRIWQLTGHPVERAASPAWRLATSQDELAIRLLYNNLVPGLVQQIEPFSTQRPKGMVYYENGDLLAYVELKYGHRGIWAQPFIHPGAQDVAENILDLLGKIPFRHSRPVYICVRSYQAWLDTVIEELGAEAGPRQAVMARQLVAPQKALRTFSVAPLDTGQPEVTAPVAHATRLVHPAQREAPNDMRMIYATEEDYR